MTLAEIRSEAARKRNATHRSMLRRASKCVAKWDDQWCEKPLTDNDLLDNVDGYCAECAGILSDNGEW